jgi:nicotinamide phosphoribosyltransferase
MARNGGPVGDRVVIRPDSGDPVLIVCGDPDGATELERKGAVEALWDIFGGTVTEKGYKLLDSHIGLIYGDAITLNRAKEITDRLAAKGFASINVVFGIGSYTYQYNTRDTFGFALKSTLCVINGDEKQIFKDPKTDNGIKKSQKGRVVVLKDGDSLKVVDGLTLKDEVKGDILTEVFRDGKLLVDQTFSEIRLRLKEGK